MVLLDSSIFSNANVCSLIVIGDMGESIIKSFLTSVMIDILGLGVSVLFSSLNGTSNSSRVCLLLGSSNWDPSTAKTFNLLKISKGYSLGD